MKNEIILYQPDELAEHIEVRVDEDTVWLNKDQMGHLFGRDRTVIGRHINNIFKEGELIEEVVCAFFALTTQHGAIKGKVQTTNVEYYNLDVIISVGYRVKSKQGTQFRIWANKVLKDYLLKGYALNNRMNRIEENVDSLAKKVEGIDLQIKTSLPPNQGIFFNGQIFDAYVFVSDLIKLAQKSVILIDNYVDETVLALLSKRKKNVKATIYTANISKQLDIDLKKHNQQYPEIQIVIYSKSHDRFLIIDEKEVYHIGASLKDLGKKWFAFSRIDLKTIGFNAKILINKLSEK
ncbi:virulence RhuM family protein [Patescibacteria group bacterium]|nr:virulence RhuM family protein [Patescibacteria group bacterium]